MVGWLVAVSIAFNAVLSLAGCLDAELIDAELSVILVGVVGSGEYHWELEATGNLILFYCREFTPESQWVPLGLPVTLPRTTN